MLADFRLSRVLVLFVRVKSFRQKKQKKQNKTKQKKDRLEIVLIAPFNNTTDVYLYQPIYREFVRMITFTILTSLVSNANLYDTSFD